MKKFLFISIIGWLIASIGGSRAVAQDTPPPPPPPPAPAAPPAPKTDGQTQEIVIRKKGNKDKKMVIEITDGKVMIDGKSIAEFKDDEVTVNGRKMIVRDGNRLMMDFDGKMMDLDVRMKDLNGRLKELDKMNFNFNDMSWGEGKTYTYMGVSTEKNEMGAKITSLTDDGPAAKAGLKEGDIIYAIGDVEIDGPNKLSETVRSKKKGDKVKVSYRRDGKKRDVTVTLGEKESSAYAFGYKTPGSGADTKVWTMPNMNSRDMYTFRRGPKLGLNIQDTEEGTGVKILKVEESSAAATAGLMKDDVITEIGGNKVTNTDEAREQLNANSEKSSYMMKARRNGSEMTFTVKIPKNLKTTTL